MRLNIDFGDKKIRFPFLVILVAMISLGNTAALPFSIASGDKDIYNFIVNSPGEIHVQATWTGTASNLALILNGPGQVSAYARQDGSSPLELRYTVTSADIKKGQTWSIGIWNFGGGTADGDLSLTSPGYPFSLGFSQKDIVELFFTVRSPGLISAQAYWTGSASDLDLSLNGPGNFGTHALGASPLGKGYMVTNEDLIKGQTWMITLENHVQDQWSTASGTIYLTYPGECSWTGRWDTNFGPMVLSQTGADVTGTYEHDGGRITGTVSPNRWTGAQELKGTWSEAPTYSPTQDAGYFELTMSDDCNSFKGGWMYGDQKSRWDGDWTGSRARGGLDLRPTGHGIF